MEVWSTVALALALSVDGLAVGVAYGMRGIDVPWRSLLIVGGCSAFCFAASLLLGRFVSGVAALPAPQLVGSAILIGLGLWHIVNGWLAKGRARGWSHLKKGAPSTLVNVRIRPLGIVIQVLRAPDRADLDRSGAIEAGEAVVLGVALGLDAAAAGFGAAFIGVGLGIVGVVAGAQLLLTWIGLHAGRRYGPRVLGDTGYYVPGLVLILLGLLQM